MKLSVIVPVYNMASEEKLNWCMDSLVNQTISDYEIIAVDDCSTDNSLEILHDYERKYPEKVRVISSSVNKKQGGAKNLGLGRAKGEWIGFIDSDDWVTPDFYERLLGLAEETGADMVGCDYHLTDEHSMKIGQVVHNNKKSQTGALTKEKYKSLILDSGSLVVKIYKRHIILDYPNRFPENIFYGIMPSAIPGCSEQSALNIWKSLFTIITSTILPLCIPSRKNGVRTGWKRPE